MNFRWITHVARRSVIVRRSSWKGGGGGRRRHRRRYPFYLCCQKSTCFKTYRNCSRVPYCSSASLLDLKIFRKLTICLAEALQLYETYWVLARRVEHAINKKKKTQIVEYERKRYDDRLHLLFTTTTASIEQHNWQVYHHRLAVNSNT